MTCPKYFTPLHFGEDVKVCVSSDYELGYAASIPFAGFESCIAGNPLAASSFNASESPNNWPHTCPHGYAQHLVAVDEGCEINFCVYRWELSTPKNFCLQEYHHSGKTQSTKSMLLKLLLLSVFMGTFG